MAPFVIAETTDAPSAERFFSEFVQTNKPLVLRGAASGWAAAQSWTDLPRLIEAHGEEVVTVAPLESSGPRAYLDKWLEPCDAWEHVEHEPNVCDAKQLLVVSAMRVKMRLKKFFKLLKAKEHAFYADGAGNLAHSFPYLRGDFAPPAFASHLLLKRADLWIGGKSISRMHYDNLDNLFAQVVGSKTFVLSPPDAGAAIQGGRRLRKAARAYTHPGGFAREGGGVMHETVLNYLSVDRPASLPTVSVTLGPGDMLYLPFGWWHEVHSHPDEALGNVAFSVSHFYEPYFCRLGGKQATSLGSLFVNPKYDQEEEEDSPLDVVAAKKREVHASTAVSSPWAWPLMLIGVTAVTAVVAVAAARRK